MPHRFVITTAIALALAATLSAGGCRPAPAPPAAPLVPVVPAAAASGLPWFRDVTAESGLDFTYRNGEDANRYTLLESLGGGVGLIDYDRDGRLDIVLPGGGGFDAASGEIQGKPTALFRNLGSGKFADVSAAVGLSKVAFYSHGCAVADYDRDGWPDFAITGFGRLALWHNEDDGRGGRTFVEVAKTAGIDDKLWSTSAAWADLDGNGFADLYVCHYADWSPANDPLCPQAGTPHGRDVCPPQRFGPQPDALFLNRGDGTFRDATAEQKIRGDGCGLGVVAADLDGNGQPDVYVGNDATPNFLYVNRGGQLEERGLTAGVALDEEGDFDGSMGVDAGDPLGTGRPALWVTNFQGEVHALYAQVSPGQFYHDEKAAGIAALGRRFVGFGTGFIDADNDGWEDLVIANGHVQRYPSETSFRQQGVLLHNTLRGGRRFFQNISPQGGDYFSRELLGRGVAIGDLNNDGWSDLVISHSNSPVVVLLSERPAAKHHWLGIELIGRDGRDVAGATVTVDVGERKIVRLAKGGGSYLSSGDRRILVGLGAADAIERVTVQWPWGESQDWGGLEPDRYYRLEEGKALSQGLPPN
jgi:hypothetical protein